jgi:transposase
MPITVTPDQRRAAKQQILAALQQGHSVSEARTSSPLPMHLVTVYRFRRRVQADPVAALEDGRHGHPVKLRGAIRQWVLEFCRNAPHTPSQVVQAALHERFGLVVSISQLNRFRAAHGISSRMRGEKAGSGLNRGVPA